MELNISKLSKRSFNFFWDGSFHNTEVKIQLPELEIINYQVSGDWGPMYKFNLSAADPIQVTYDGETYKLEDKTLKVESPILAKDRAMHPYYFAFTDEFKGVSFKIYINENYELGKVQVINLHTESMLFSSDQNQFQQVM